MYTWHGTPKYPPWEVQGSAGVCVSPVVDADGFVYAQCSSSALAKVDPSDGSIVWSTTTHVVSPPFALDCNNGLFTLTVAGPQIKLVKFNTISGVAQWEYGPINNVCYSTPTVGMGIAVFGCNDNIHHAVNTATGASAWTYTCPSGTAGGAVFHSSGDVFLFCWVRIVRVNGATGTYVSHVDLPDGPAHGGSVLTNDGTKLITLISDTGHQLRAYPVALAAALWTRPAGIAGQINYNGVALGGASDLVDHYYYGIHQSSNFVATNPAGTNEVFVSTATPSVPNVAATVLTGAGVAMMPTSTGGMMRMMNTATGAPLPDLLPTADGQSPALASASAFYVSGTAGGPNLSRYVSYPLVALETRTTMTVPEYSAGFNISVLLHDKFDKAGGFTVEVTVVSVTALGGGTDYTYAGVSPPATAQVLTDSTTLTHLRLSFAPGTKRIDVMFDIVLDDAVESILGEGDETLEAHLHNVTMTSPPGHSVHLAEGAWNATVVTIVDTSVGYARNSSWPKKGRDAGGWASLAEPVAAHSRHPPWAFRFGSLSSNADPAVGLDGTIYGGSNDGSLHALFPNGSLAWSFPTGGQVVSAPAVGADGTIYVTSDSSSLLALSADGTLRWSMPTSARMRSSPVLGDNEETVYAASEDSRLYAFRAWDGAPVYNVTTGGIVSLASPTAAAGGTVYVGSDAGGLLSVRPDGTVRWNYTTNWKIKSSVAIDEAEMTLYFGANDGILHAVRSDGTARWTYTTSGNVEGTPVIDGNGTVYFGSHDAAMRAVRSDGTLKWSTALSGGNVRPRALVHPSGDTVHVGSDNGCFNTLGTENGEIRWQYCPAAGALRSGAAIAPDGSFYFSCFDGLLYHIVPYPIVYISGSGPTDITNLDNSIVAHEDQGVARVTVRNGDASLANVSFSVDLVFTDGTATGSGVDYDSTTVTVTFAEGEFEKSIEVPVVLEPGPSHHEEGNETFVVSLANLVQLSGNATVLLAESRVESTVTIIDTQYPFANSSWPRRGRDNSGRSSMATIVQRHPDTSFRTAGDVFSSPSIGSDGTVYCGGEDGLYAFDGGLGLRWVAPVGSVHSSPAIGPDGALYVGTNWGTIAAVEPADGSVRWSYGNPTTQATSSPALGADGTVYSGFSDGKFVALHGSNGTERWTYAMGGLYRGSSTVSRSGTVFVPDSFGATLYALDGSTGALLWNLTTGGLNFFRCDPALVSHAGVESVIAGSYDNNLYALDPVTGSERWRFNPAAEIAAGVAVGVLDGVIYVGSRAGTLHALAAADGSVLWSFAGVGSIVWTPALGLNDTTVLVPSEDGNIYALDSATGGELWRFSTGGAVGSPSVAPDGSIYIGSADDYIYHIVFNSTVYLNISTLGIVREDAGYANITVLRGGMDDAPAFTIDLIPTDGTASAASGDYLAGAVSLMFGPGVREVVARVPVVHDAVWIEPDETFTVTLANLVVLTPGSDVFLAESRNSGIVTITNIDPTWGVPPLQPQPPAVSATGLAATGIISVTWTVPSAMERGNLPVTVYTVYRDGVAIGAPTPGLTLLDTSALENTAYTYTLRFNTSLGASPISSGIVVTTPFRAPALVSVTPSVVPIAGGVTLTLGGSFFGASAAELTHVTVDGVNTTIGLASWISAAEVQVTAPPAPGLAPGSANVVVYTVHGSSAAVAVSFSYALPPNVTSVVPLQMGRLEGGRIVGVVGEGLGNAAGEVSSVTLAGVPCGSITWRNASHIDCTAGVGPAGVGRTVGPVVVTLSTTGSSSTGPLFTYTAPMVTTVDPAQGPIAGGTTITLHGSDMGLSATDVIGVNISHPSDGPLPCAPVVRVSDLMVTCVTSAATAGTTGANAFVEIATASGGIYTTSTSPAIGFSYTGSSTSGPGPVVPVVVGVNPSSGPISGGTFVTITGTNLGASAADVASITIAGAPCTPTIFVSATELRCTTSPVSATPLAGLSGPVVVTTVSGGGSASVPLVVFSYYDPTAIAPTVTALVPPTGSTRGGYIVSVYGVSFGSTPSSVAGINFGTGNPATEVVFHDGTFVECTAPVGSPGTAPVSVLPSLLLSSSSSSGSATAALPVPLGFTYVYPAPVLDNARPRLVRSAGGTTVVFRGEYFGVAPGPVSLTIMIGTQVCLSPVWLSETEVQCVTPPVPTAASGTAVLDVPITVKVDGQSSSATQLGVLTGTAGFRYGTVDCDAACGYNQVCNDLTGSCELCIPGWVGSACNLFAVAIQRADRQIASAGAGAGSSSSSSSGGGKSGLIVAESPDDFDDEYGAMTVSLRESPGAGQIAFRLSPSVQGEVEIVPSEVTFSSANFATPQSVIVRAVDDRVKDGNRTVLVTPEISAGTGRFADSTVRPSMTVATIDAFPSVISVEPTVVPLAGRVNATITGDHWDEWVEVWIEKKRVGEFKVLRPSTPSSISSSRSRRLETSQTTASSTSTDFPPSLGGSIVVPINKTDLKDAPGGYHLVSVVNMYTRTRGTDATMLYATVDCPTPGEYGTGKDCEPCPKGGRCPGGYRIWPEPGYWNPGEDAGYVARCDPPEACLGTRERICAPGYEGYLCGKCADRFFRANGRCSPCPEAESTLIFVIGDVAVWLLFAVSAVAVRDRMTLSYIVMAVRALSMLGAVGKMTEGEDIPQWVITVYEILYIFSGDYSFVKPDCVTPAPWAQIFGVSLAYNIGVFVPVFVAIGVARCLAADDGETSERVSSTGDGDVSHPNADQGERNDAPLLRPRTKSYWDDRAVRMCVIWGAVVYLSVTSLAMETLSCIRIGNDGTHRMITRPHELCFVGDHIIITAAACILLLGFTLGFPLGMLRWVKKPEHVELLHADERFMERWNYLYEFYNIKNPTFWLIEFPITCIVAAGNSVLRPHVNYQMSISVAVFAYKLLYILVRRPFIDWITDVIQAVMALVSLVAINMTFFSRHGVFEKVPALSVSLSAIIAVFLAAAIVGMIGMIVWLFFRPAGAAEEARQKRARGALGTAFYELRNQISVPAVPSTAWSEEEEGENGQVLAGALDNAKAIARGEAQMEVTESDNESAGMVDTFIEFFSNTFGGLSTERNPQQQSESQLAHHDNIESSADNNSDSGNDIGG